MHTPIKGLCRLAFCPRHHPIVRSGKHRDAPLFSTVEGLRGQLCSPLPHGHAQVKEHPFALEQLPEPPELHLPHRSVAAVALHRRLNPSSVSYHTAALSCFLCTLVCS
jgi:hypothetical protein